MNKMIKFSHKKAFTLAEVLITLGIIGIVAALTLPSLIQKQQEKAVISKLKKVYSTLQQSFLLAVNDYGTPDNWDLSVTKTDQTDESGNMIYDYKGTDNIAYILSKYTKNAKKCEKGKKCFSNLGDWYAFNGVNLNADMTKPMESSNAYVLADGTIIWIGWVASVTCKSNYGQNNTCADLHVILNPDKRKLIYGKDIFHFLLTKTGIFPSGTTSDLSNTFEDRCSFTNTTTNNGRGCTAWALYNENLDYLHCEGLSWDGKHSCKDKK